MNRGLARRTVFEGERDVRYFLSRLARAVHAGSIELHAYCVLTTHFHLLLRSPEGRLSECMRVVQNEYVRWFNRGRRRDGALFRGRFASKAVASVGYREQLVRYIDSNAVQARLVGSPSEYRFGSAHWLARGRRPAWLATWWIEGSVRDFAGSSRFSFSDYAELFGQPASVAFARVIDRRLASPAKGADPLNDLLDAAPERVLAWMRRKRTVADGAPMDLPVCDEDTIRDLVAPERAQRPDWTVAVSRRPLRAWLAIEIALLRTLSVTSWNSIGARVRLTDTGAIDVFRRHQIALDIDPEYAATTAHLASRCLDACYGNARHRRILRDGV